MASLREIIARRDRWREAIASGAPLADHALAALPGCRRAVTQLEARLHALGYPVEGFLRPAPADLDARLAGLQEQTGVPVPPVVREFWRVLGGVSFVDLDAYAHDAFWSGLGITGPHGFCDGFHVDAFDPEWVEYTVEDYESCAEDGDEASFRYTLAPDGYHKDNISGGPPYAVGRDSAWAPAWENFFWSGYRRPETAVPDPPDFLSYVRTALLECAGFPGLLGHPGFERLRPALIDGLEPF